MKRVIFFLLLMWRVAAFAVTDFDYVIVGTSPFSTLEALYQYYSGNRVLMLEESASCGGAWKSINICGFPHVDMGCHEIGCQRGLKDFLEEYVGCTLLSMDDPSMKYSEDSGKHSKGFYPAGGCHEIMDHLSEMLAETEITVLLNHKMESVFINTQQNYAEVKTRDQIYTVSKIVLPTNVDLVVENLPSNMVMPQACTSKHHHLYLLIRDSSHPCFTYEDNLIPGISRAANLTWFVGLEGSGKQLIVLQPFEEEGLTQEGQFLEAMIDKGLLTENAEIIRKETYLYEQCHTKREIIDSLKPEERNYFRILNSFNFGSMTKYIDEWRKVIKPYQKTDKPEKKLCGSCQMAQDKW